MKLPRYLVPAVLIAPVASILIVAPSAAAGGCSSSGDTKVCGQGDVRGGSGRAPVNHSANPDASEKCRWTCNDDLFRQP